MNIEDVYYEIQPKTIDYGDIIYLTEFGSYLYGTNTPESDKDYKGIFLPHKDDLLLGIHKKSFQYSSGDNSSKNTKNDIDVQLWSLQYWFNLLMVGDTNAIDLLYGINAKHQEKLPKEDRYFIKLIKTYNFKNLINLSAKGYIGYAYNQAKKYGIKGSRIAYLRDLIHWVELHEPDKKLSDYIISIFSFKFMKDEEHEWMKYDFEKKVLWILGKGYPLSLSFKDMLQRLQKQLDQYGNRAQLAEENEGVDWKAISHAMRCLAQIDEIVKTGNLNYPLKDREYLKQIKLGLISWNKFKPILENFLLQVTNLCNESEFPSKEEIQELHSEIIWKTYELEEQEN